MEKHLSTGKKNLRKQITFHVFSVLSLSWWLFIVFTVLEFLVVGCFGFKCTLARFSERNLISIYIVAIVMALLSALIIYKKYLHKHVLVMQIIFILTTLLLVYTFFFSM